MRRLAPFLVLLAGCGTTRPETPARPNILFILADDLGYGDLGCFGNREVRTPHLDRLAAEGARLTNFYVTWPACTPSRGSILTGRYPRRNGLYEMIRNDLVDQGFRYTEETYATSPEMTLGMDLREVSFAQVLKSAGYATGVVGKWDGGRAERFLPLQRGFDFFYGFANTGIDYWTHERYGIPSMFRGNARVKEPGYATDLFRREAVRFMRERRDGPFALYVAFNAPHGPSNLERTGMQAPDDAVARYPGLDPTANKTRYLACVTRLDDAVGELLATLRELGLDRNTLVLLSSDNGGTKVGSNGPLRGFKGQLFEGGLRVPTIARWPGRVPAGSTRDEVLSALDLFPTFLGLAGARAPEGLVLDGVDLMPVLEGKARSPRRDLFWEHSTSRAARVGSLKWIETADGSGGLYDLAADVGESRDLSRERPDALDDLRRRWAAWKQTMDRAEPRGPFRED
ncbi:MAG TPA: sulfatase-like hydrolase/transferase [Planctomycetota bacterium]